jgi:hypothetical protein
VLVDVLPKDLQERIKTAFEALSWGWCRIVPV